MEETRKMRRVRKEIITGKRVGMSDILNGKKSRKSGRECLGQIIRRHINHPVHLPVVSRTGWRTWEARSDGAEVEVGVRSHWALTVSVNNEEAVWRMN